MPIKRLIALAAFASLLPLSATLQATDATPANFPVAAQAMLAASGPQPLYDPSSVLAPSGLPLPATHFGIAASEPQPSMLDVSRAVAETAGGSMPAAHEPPAPVTTSKEKVTDLRKALIALAMKLRDIRYVRGGHDPSTGFDCSGFVRYVFAHAVGMQLPTNSASQFLAGLKVKRADMKPGDLVFFHTYGKRRISHVGIYISDGQFIHSPASGKSVQISSLDDAYWAKHFVGAKRPEAIAMISRNG